MSKKFIPQILFLLIFSTSALCATEEEMGQAAEQAGKLRDALTHYVSALQSLYEGSADDQRLREKIIEVAQKLDPPPAIPDEVITYEGRAEAAAQSAQTPEEMMVAASEYKKALKLAPWNASYYFNLGLVLEKAGAYQEAIQNFRFYLLAAPNAQDALEVKKKIGGLEFRMEKTTKDADAQRAEEAKKQAMRESLTTGTWWETEKRPYQKLSTTRPIVIQVSGEQFTSQWDYVDGSGMILRGSIDGLSVSGTVTMIICCPKFSLPGSFTGSISPDGRSVNIRVVDDTNQYDYKLWRQ